MNRLAALLVLVLLALGACGDDPTDGAVATDTSDTSDSADGSDDEPIGEERDPEALDAEEVCTGVSDAWIAGDRDAAARFFSDEAGVDQLFEVAFDEVAYTDTELEGDRCVLHQGDGDGVIELYGDGHAGWRAAGVSWVPSAEDGDGIGQREG